jgi:hypothetical protein
MCGGVVVGMEFSQGLQLEKSETPGWLEEADNVFFTQGVNVRQSHIIASFTTLKNIEGENLDGIFGLCHEIPVQQYSHRCSHIQEWRIVS